jgi:hypothetical protein
MIRGPYLLDTSAFRSLPGWVLQNLSGQGQSFFASPYCFWEIISHLNEPGQFDYYKGNLMKFRYVQVLNDPQAELETPLLVEDRDLQERVPDSDLIEAALAALHESSSLDAFYSTYIEDSNGRPHQVSGCVQRLGRALETRKERHIDLINDIIEAFGSGQVDLETDTSRHQAILDLVEGWVIQLGQRGASVVGLRERLINGTYIYWAYIFHRALQYFEKGKSDVDPNDYEDGQICLHLRLDTPFCLVTGDIDMREALEETVALLHKLKDPQIRTTLRVSDVGSLRHSALPEEGGSGVPSKVTR